VATLVLVGLQRTAARPVVLRHARGDHLSANGALHDLSSDMFVVKLVTLATKTPLLGALQLSLNGANASARTRPLRLGGWIRAGVLAATEMHRRVLVQRVEVACRAGAIAERAALRALTIHTHAATGNMVQGTCGTRYTCVQPHYCSELSTRQSSH
jgi:hypothetical protein